ncbi:AAA family ATPase [Nocardioides perillae]|uniref:MinD-like ATPase involved in chromosome partitioning or flagellar assembly n=1 Tax=Nocardioides perillae TaxID=1119534 RepID=A0A7Y9RWH1_9ACTN|nr:hypothetical protein [Nocardioides perillae]NYG56671.1 MinD-like ATPase involved in chromosome partitioning or flagellar assembly [Nocardioides perillae]
MLVTAAGAAWETRALALFEGRPEVVLLKRCVDVDDLMAAATSGQADAAVVALDAPGLDATAVEHLRRHRVAPLVVAAVDGSAEAARTRAQRIGSPALLPEAEVDRLVEAVLALPQLDEADAGAPAAAPDLPGVLGVDPHAGVPAGAEASRLAGAAVPGTAPQGGTRVVVWGPTGAPGRTTVAVGIAAAVAARAGAPRPVLLVDADPWGGAVAQHLGVLDEVSGVLAAARLTSSGELAERFAEVPRAVGERLHVVTGLPRPDRWSEVRAGVLDHLLELAVGGADVVVDTGPSLEEDPVDLGSVRPGRQQLTLEAVDAADELVVVGAADPVGLARLARGLVELRERTGGRPVHVVVNRMRPSLGWGEREVAGMVEGFTRVASLHVLPDDRAGADAALVAGRSLVETGDSALGRALDAVAEAVLPGPGPAAAGARRGPRGARGPRGLRRRRAGRARRR